MSKMPWDITRDMFLDESETGRLLAHVQTAAEQGIAAARLDRLIVECLLFSGLRSSEFCQLCLRDTWLGHRLPALLVRGGRKGGRMVYLPRPTNRLIRDYVRDVRPHILPDGTDPDDLDQPLVFSERRQPMERTGLYRRVVRILTAAGLGHRASVQLLRHTCGYLSYLRTAGNLLFVQRQLGHAHPMITAIYAQFVEEDYGALADTVGLAGATHAGRAAREERS